MRKKIDIPNEIVNEVLDWVEIVTGVERMFVCSRSRRKKYQGAKKYTYKILLGRGYSYKSIARAFEVTHASILWHFRRSDAAKLKFQ